MTLVAEKTALAEKYDNKSVAEQNSVDLAWNLLMSPKYHALRSAIYSNDVEMRRFRQLVVNSVMATDIADKDQKVFRNARWDRAFHETVIENEQDSINRKATIVIEHLIQASDVSHTMQHVRSIVVSHLLNDQTFQKLTLYISPLISYSGIFIVNGINDFLKNVTRRTNWDVLIPILQRIGIKVRSVSLTFTLFHWPKS